MHDLTPEHQSDRRQLRSNRHRGPLSLNKEEQKEKATISNNQPLKGTINKKLTPDVTPEDDDSCNRLGAMEKSNNQPSEVQKINNQPPKVHREKITQEQKGTK